ncbi:MAG TPA: DMT family transporter [Pseudomonadales bacterium]|nr:DMT family transporter [Pseudomonadales bacterium]
MTLPPTTALDPGAARDQRALVGVAWMLLGTLMGSAIDACVKALQGDFDTPQIVLLRLLCALPFVLLFARFTGGLGGLRTRRWRWHLLRAACASGATFGFFYALGELPLVLVVTIGFASPLLIAALSRPFLGERVGIGRWIGIAVGFGGVVIALQPGSTAWHPAMLAVLASTLCWAILAMSARRIGSDEPMGIMVLGTMPLSILIGVALALPAWVSPAPADWLLFGLLGLCGASAHYCVVFAYRAASGATVAPMEYTGLIWTASFGWVFWAEVPDAWTLVGAAVIVGGGLMVLRASD